MSRNIITITDYILPESHSPNIGLLPFKQLPMRVGQYVFLPDVKGVWKRNRIKAINPANGFCKVNYVSFARYGDIPIPLLIKLQAKFHRLSKRK